MFGAMATHLLEPWEERVDGVGCRSVNVVDDVERSEALTLLLVRLR